MFYPIVSQPLMKGIVRAFRKKRKSNKVETKILKDEEIDEEMLLERAVACNFSTRGRSNKRNKKYLLIVFFKKSGGKSRGAFLQFLFHHGEFSLFH